MKGDQYAKQTKELGTMDGDRSAGDLRSPHPEASREPYPGRLHGTTVRQENQVEKLEGKTMTLKARYSKAYERGVKAAKAYDSFREYLWATDRPAYEVLAPDYWLIEAFERAGFEGITPEYVEAVRYGAIPASGKSMNHAEGIHEAGVSVIRILRNPDDFDRPSIYDVLLGLQGLEKIRVAGWYIETHGSDGEPLIVDAIEV